MKTSTMYLIGGGVGVVALGTVLYFTLRKPALPGGGGGGQLPQGGGGNPTPPPAPNPQNYGQPTPQNQQNFANDINNWVNVMKGLQLSVPLIRSLYNTVQSIASSFGFLLPASPI
jgi:hypothetical protein